MEETFDLIRLSQDGDKDAKEQLIKMHSGLIWNVVRRFMGRGYETEDLYQIGAIGLIRAIDKFDFGYDVKFSTYAVPLIAGEIKRFLRDDGMIKVSRDLRKKGTVIMKAKEDFTKEHGREPHLSELSSICHMSTEDISYALEAICPVYSLQDTIGNDEDGATLESVTPAGENIIEEMTDKLALAEAISKLDPRSQQIVRLRYYRDLSQQQTADILGITQVKVSREEKKIFEFLRKEFLSGNH